MRDEIELEKASLSINACHAATAVANGSRASVRRTHMRGNGGRKVLVDVGRHCGYRGGGGSTPRQRRGVDSGRPHAWTGGRGIFGDALLGRHADPSQSRITRGPARSRELPTSISKANDIPGAKRGANGGRRQATPRDVWRRRVQLTGTSSYIRRRLATAGLRLTARGHWFEPSCAHQVSPTRRHLGGSLGFYSLPVGARLRAKRYRYGPGSVGAATRPFRGLNLLRARQQLLGRRRPPGDKAERGRKLPAGRRRR